MRPSKEFLNSEKGRFLSFYRSYHKAVNDLTSVCDLSKKLKTYGSPEIYSRWLYDSKKAAASANEALEKLEAIMESIIEEIHLAAGLDLNWNIGGVSLRGHLYVDKTCGETKNFDFLKHFYTLSFKTTNPETDAIQIIPVFHITGNTNEDFYRLIQVMEEIEPWRF